MDKFKGMIDYVRVHQEMTGFFVADAIIEGSRRPITIKGTADFLPLGMVVTFEGKHTHHPKWGKQFDVNRILYETHLDAIKALFSSGLVNGIKDRKAVTLVETLGEEIIDIMDMASRLADNPDVANARLRLLEVNGVGPTVLGWMTESWRASRGWAIVALTGLRAGLTFKQTKKVYDKFEDDAMDMILKTPYRLSVIPSITWEVADAVAKSEWPGKTAIPHDSPMRYAAGVREVLRLSTFQGHTCMPWELCMIAAIDLCKPRLNKNPKGFWSQVATLDMEEEDLALVKLPDESLYLYDRKMYDFEAYAAHKMSDMIKAGIRCSRSIPTWEQVEQDIDVYSAPIVLSEGQKNAVRTCLENPVAVITGGPGTGKTTTIHTLTRILTANRITFTLVAPTGKAARRMEEAVGHPAGTIHRTIGLGIKETEWPQYKFMTDVVIADEMSMTDARLIAKMLSAINLGHPLWMVGDPDQLPPVGPGEPFYQFITAGIPVARLDVIYRHGKDGGIVNAAASIRKGEMPSGNYDDYKYGTVADNRQLPKTVIDMSQRVMEKYNVRPDDFQILTPLNNHGWGQRELNNMLQKVFNPGHRPISWCLYKLGDRVIQLKNNYNLSEHGIMNGQIGTVFWLNTEQHGDWDPQQELIQDPDKVNTDELKIKWQDDELAKLIVGVNFDGEKVYYDYDTMKDELALAYALTIHKSQGSEYDYGIVLIPTTRPSFQTRQLIYTGITRYKKYVLVISTQNAAWNYINNEQRIRRHTLLRNFFLEEVSGAKVDLRELFAGEDGDAQDVGTALGEDDLRGMRREDQRQPRVPPRVAEPKIQESKVRSSESSACPF